MRPTCNDIRKAQVRMKGVIQPSPLIRSGHLSRTLGAEIFLKLENLQETGSFKVRGAYNRLSRLTPEEKSRGVIAASAGNHAQGVAWAALRLGIRAKIVMPENVSLKKLLAVKEYDAEIILFGSHYSNAYSRALEISRQTGMILIPGFDDAHVIAGQGTIGLELADILEGEVAIVVPIGGGGLISGIALAAKAVYPRVQVIGVQTKSCPSMIRSLEEKSPVAMVVGPTLADGIAVSQPGDLNFKIIQKHVDRVVAVDEEAIAGAILNLLEKTNILAEGAGATPLAVLMESPISARIKRYILIISGGNIETNTIDRILHRGLIKMGRLVRVEVNLLDAPGSLWKLLGLVAAEKANILHIYHDRLDLENPIEVSRVVLSLETRGHEHTRELMARFKSSGYPVKLLD
jgi:threonine dehydratase